MSTANLECPKCFGSGELRHFANVHGGTCFLCVGQGAVDEKTASRWLAAQFRQDLPRAESNTAPNTDTSGRSKWVVLGHLGECRINRHDDGTFSLIVPSDVGYLPTGFVIARGKVHMMPSVTCNGLGKRLPEIAAVLQSALKVA